MRPKIRKPDFAFFAFLAFFGNAIFAPCASAQEPVFPGVKPGGAGSCDSSESSRRSDLNRYCRFLETGLARIWRPLQGFDEPVKIDFNVDAGGYVTIIGASRNSRARASEKAIAIKLAMLAKQIPAPPAGLDTPVRLQANLANDAARIRVNLRSIDWDGILEEFASAVRQRWHPPASSRSASQKSAYCRIAIARAFNDPDIGISLSSGDPAFDRSVFATVRGASRVLRLPDSGPDRLTMELFLSTAGGQGQDTQALGKVVSIFDAYY